LDNLVAFTRLLGYVRYFHPSDQAAEADWDRIAIAGARAAETAAGPEELARALEETFRPVAPTVRVFPTGSKPALPDELHGSGEAWGWEHHGLETVPGSIFKSRRIARPFEEPFEADLGGGVSALVPLTLYRSLAQGKAEPPAAVEDPRATRLAAVALAWNVPQHFYPYFDVVAVDWPAELRRALTSAATDADERAFLLTLRRMMASLRDAHAGVMHRSFPLAARLPFHWEWIEDRLVVTDSADPNLRPGDVVLRIDGRPAAEAIREWEEVSPGATPQGLRAFVLFELSLGAKDSEMALEVKHPSGETATVPVRRTHAIMGPGGLPEARPDDFSEVAASVLYVDLTRVGDDEVKAQLGRLATAKAVIFDLRGYSFSATPALLGHLTDKPLLLAPYQTAVVTRPDRQGWTFETGQTTVEPAAPRLQAKAIFLADGRTVSAAETFLKAVEHHHLGEIVGSTTAGTTGNAAPFQVPGGYMVLWTQLKSTDYDGSRFHGVGVHPTVAAARTLRGVIDGKDEVLERALELAGQHP
jgi:C-terminal processing protease CtpA/Prc